MIKNSSVSWPQNSIPLLINRREQTSSEFKFKQFLFVHLIVLSCLLSVYAVETPDFKGRIELGIFQGDRWVPETSANAFIVVQPVSQKIPTKRTPKKWVVDMHEKEFLPNHLLVRAGDEISFKNSDNFNHNVFSLSKELTFDLGSYGKGQSRKIISQRDGLVKIYCNVHANMAFFLLVTSSPWGVPADQNGDFVIPDLPKGKYIIHLWHWKGHQEYPLEWEGQVSDIAYRLNVRDFKVTDHKNKYGLNYPPEDDDEEIY